MSAIVDNSRVVANTNQTVTTGTVLDLQDIDIISVSVTYAPVLTGTATIALYESVDGENYVAITGQTVAVSAPGTVIWHVSPVFSKWMKILFTPTTGGVTYAATISARNNSTISNGVGIPVTTTAS